MQSPQQFANTKFLFLFNLNTESFNKPCLKIVYNASVIVILIFNAKINDALRIENIFYLILYDLHLLVFILGMICTFWRKQSIDTMYKVLAAMQIIFIIGLIPTAIVSYPVLNAIMYNNQFLNVLVVMFFGLVCVSYVLAVGFATLCFYFYFKRTVTEGTN
jgi:hypothetical protein